MVVSCPGKGVNLMTLAWSGTEFYGRGIPGEGMAMFCGYCGGLIGDEVVSPGRECEIVYWDNGSQVVLSPERALGFCSDLCAWRYGVDYYKARGMSGKAARRYLIERHDLTSPGKAPEDGQGAGGSA